MNEPEPLIHDAAPTAPEPTTNGSPAADVPVAAEAPPPAEPVLVEPPLGQSSSEVYVIAPPTPPAEPASAPVGAAEGESLESRLLRLEAALAKFADPKLLEDRLAERLSKRVEQGAPVASIAAAPVAVPLPSSALGPHPPSRANQWLDIGRRWLPLGLGWRAKASAANDGRSDLRPSWLFLDILREAQSILHMYGDPRYRLTWSGRVFPMVFFLLILTSNVWLKPLTWWVPDSVSFIVTVFVKVVDLALAFCFCKVLSREARRYRETIQPYPIPPH